MKKYQIIDHTADIGIRVSGATLVELFINAAEGMVDLMVECRGAVEPWSRREIAVEAISREHLLVKWLEELLYLFEIKHLVPISFDIKSFTDKKLEAEVGSVPFDQKIHRPKHQIKAVTYHNLEIKEEKGKFETTIIFDI